MTMTATNQNISEAASEKPQRGRPRLMSPSHEARFRGIWTDLRSRRSIQDRHLGLAAIDALGGFDDRCKRYPWLFPHEEVFRWSLLAELGRLDDAETIRETANVFERDRPAVKPSADTVQRARRRGWRG